jgi:hypothetical protein
VQNRLLRTGLLRALLQEALHADPRPAGRPVCLQKVLLCVGL